HLYRLGMAGAIRFAQQEKRKAEEKEKGAAAIKDKERKEADKKDDEELKVPPAEAIEIQLTLPRSQPQGSFVLKNARVVTMKGDAVLDDADVVVTGNRIAAVGPAGQVAVPAGAKSWDARGKTVIPGLIDTHPHPHSSASRIS